MVVEQHTMDDRDIFAIISLIGGFLVLVVSYGRTAVALNYKENDKKPTYLWGELRSENAKFTFMGWVVGEILNTISIGSTLLIIYYYINPYSWWLLNASVITFMTGAFSWYDLTRVVYCNNVRDLAAIPVLLMVLGNSLMIVTLIHPDTTTLTFGQGDMIAYRMSLVMLGISFLHHLVMDVFVWYFSFVYMKKNDKVACEPVSAQAAAPSAGSDAIGLSNRRMGSLIGSQRRSEIAGHAC